MTDNHNHEHTGKFFEEFVQLFPDGTAKGLGVRLVEEQDGRLLGVAGTKIVTMTEPFIVLRCFRQVLIRASKNAPVEVMTTLQIIEGRK
jgi:hypothetical protein